MDLASAFDVTDPYVTNVARVLQILDDDADPSNGITIPAAVRGAAAGMSMDFDRDSGAFEADAGVQAANAALTAETSSGARQEIFNLPGTLGSSGDVDASVPGGALVYATIATTGEVSGRWYAAQGGPDHSGTMTGAKN